MRWPRRHALQNDNKLTSRRDGCGTLGSHPMVGSPESIAKELMRLNEMGSTR